MANGFPMLIWRELSIPLPIVGVLGILLLDRKLALVLYGMIGPTLLFSWGLTVTETAPGNHARIRSSCWATRPRPIGACSAAAIRLAATHRGSGMHSPGCRRWRWPASLARRRLLPAAQQSQSPGRPVDRAGVVSRSAGG
ncbi:MAG: hypothetical protein R3A10_00485 [Caldilineaceae bacterium]